MSLSSLIFKSNHLLISLIPAKKPQNIQTRNSIIQNQTIIEISTGMDINGSVKTRRLFSYSRWIKLEKKERNLARNVNLCNVYYHLFHSKYFYSEMEGENPT